MKCNPLIETAWAYLLEPDNIMLGILINIEGTYYIFVESIIFNTDFSGLRNPFEMISYTFVAYLPDGISIDPMSSVEYESLIIYQ